MEKLRLANRKNKAWHACRATLCQSFSQLRRFRRKLGNPVLVTHSLADILRAVIMGECSFGKGSVQTIIPLPENSAMRLSRVAVASGVVRGKLPLNSRPQ
jgi:hypothetical protein